MLSQSLRELERDGIVIRHQYNEVPPHVDYTMTKKGKSVIPALTLLGDWAKEFMKEEKLYSECEICLSEEDTKKSVHNQY